MKSSHLTAIALGVASLAAGAIALGGCLARAGASSLDAGSFLALHADSPAQAAEPSAGLAASPADGKATVGEAGDSKAGGRDGKAGLSGEGQTGETPASAGEASRCAPGMVLVEGDYCPDVEHVCKRWLENEGRYKHYRCEEYTSAKCLSKARVHKSFCMDRDEYVPPGESLPASRQSWNDATRVCSDQGKRVCMESEWNFACEGEEMRPYPYGWKRDAEACNADRVDIYRADGQLRDLRMGAGDKPRCVSPFGVHHLSGNLEEFVSMDGTAFGGAPPKPAMKGAYWQPSRNHCRANQTAHDRFYKGTETGFRCCSDPPN
jgi:hypothetical protein